VAVHQTRREHRPVRVEDFLAPVAHAHARDPRPADGHVRRHHLEREDIRHTRIFDHQIRDLHAPRDPHQALSFGAGGFHWGIIAVLIGLNARHPAREKAISSLVA
jgi:hypothetical protein